MIHENPENQDSMKEGSSLAKNAKINTGSISKSGNKFDIAAAM